MVVSWHNTQYTAAGVWRSWADLFSHLKSTSTGPISTISVLCYLYLWYLWCRLGIPCDQNSFLNISDPTILCVSFQWRFYENWNNFNDLNIFECLDIISQNIINRSNIWQPLSTCSYQDDPTPDNPRAYICIYMFPSGSHNWQLLSISSHQVPAIDNSWAYAPIRFQQLTTPEHMFLSGFNTWQVEPLSICSYQDPTFVNPWAYILVWIEHLTIASCLGVQR